MKFFIEAVKESTLLLWRLKIWVILVGFLVLGIVGGGTYIISHQIGDNIFYNPITLIDHLKALSNVSPELIRNFILNGYGLMWLILILVFMAGMIYSCYIFILKIFMNELLKKEVWVEDCWPNHKEFTRALKLLIVVLMFVGLVSLVLIIIIIFAHDIGIVPQELIALILLPIVWLYISTYFAINFMVVNDYGVIENIKKSIKMVSTNKIRFGIVGLIIPVLITVLTGWGLLVLTAYTLALSSYYTVMSSDDINK
jgi:preprotein translocase subunit Sss1